MLVILSIKGIVVISNDKFNEAQAIFISHGGIISTGEALSSGIHPRTLYAMRDNGQIVRLDRGLYRLSDLPTLSNPDLVSVALKIPNGIICLISALSFHELTTQIPHEIYVAIRRNSEAPRLSYPPIRIFWLTGKSYTEGVEKHTIDNVSVKIYSAEKTITDCFKYRNKIGRDIAIEALKLYRERRQIKLNDIMLYAKICRVENVIRPYLEALI